MECKNCNTVFEGNYCPQCGQKATVKRFSTRLVFSEVVDKVLPLDRGVLFTAKQLLTKPGLMLRAYLDGKRVNYTKPFQFVLVVAAVSLLLFSRGDFQRGMEDGWKQQGDADARIMAIQQAIGAFLLDHLTLIMLGIIPFIALIARWLYRKYGLNYAEHLVMSAYIIGGCTMISIPFMTILHLAGKNPFYPLATALFILAYVGFFCYAHLSFFKEGNRILIGLKGILTYLIGYFLYILFIGLLSVVIIFFMIRSGQG